jgi:hypothetical protein
MLIFNMQPCACIQQLAIASCLLLWLRDDDQEAMMMMSEAGGRYRWLMMPSMLVGIMHTM